MAFYDRYGNPTYGTLCALYEDEHDIGEGPMAIEELCKEINIWREDVDNEDSHTQDAV
ncbi:MAG: hypothetical protein IJU26_06090 [Synergistaceae bacterium]|nr:hypothetical protein [Synergistaceae bacterium]